MSKDVEALEKKYMEVRVEGRRPIGRPRRTWLENVDEDCQNHRLIEKRCMAGITEKGML